MVTGDDIAEILAAIENWLKRRARNPFGKNRLVFANAIKQQPRDVDVCGLRGVIADGKVVQRPEQVLTLFSRRFLFLTFRVKRLPNRACGLSGEAVVPHEDACQTVSRNILGSKCLFYSAMKRIERRDVAVLAPELKAITGNSGNFGARFTRAEPAEHVHEESVKIGHVIAERSAERLDKIGLLARQFVAVTAGREGLAQIEVYRRFERRKEFLRLRGLGVVQCQFEVTPRLWRSWQVLKQDT